MATLHSRDFTMDLHRTMDHHPRTTVRHLKATLPRMAIRQCSATAKKGLADDCTDLRDTRLKGIHLNNPPPSQGMHTHQDRRVAAISRYWKYSLHSIWQRLTLRGGATDGWFWLCTSCSRRTRVRGKTRFVRRLLKPTNAKLLRRFAFSTHKCFCPG